MASAPPDTVMQAVALGYKPGMPAPRVLAQGRGELAQAIIDRAKSLGIPTRTERHDSANGFVRPCLCKGR